MLLLNYWQSYCNWEFWPYFGTWWRQWRNIHSFTKACSQCHNTPSLMMISLFVCQLSKHFHVLVINVYREATLRSLWDVIDDVITLKNTFSCIVPYDHSIYDVKSKRCLMCLAILILKTFRGSFAICVMHWWCSMCIAYTETYGINYITYIFKETYPYLLAFKFKNVFIEIRKSRDYIYGLWEYTVLSVKRYFRVKTFEGKNY